MSHILDELLLIAALPFAKLVKLSAHLRRFMNNDVGSVVQQIIVVATANA
jgi:hypothetical protein